MMLITIIVLSLAGFALLALAMAKHQWDVFGRSLTSGKTLLLRSGGWLLQAASLYAAIVCLGVGAGITLWIGIITVTVLIVAMWMTYGVPS